MNQLRQAFKDTGYSPKNAEFRRIRSTASVSGMESLIKEELIKRQLVKPLQGLARDHAVFTIVGARGYKQETAIANIYALNEQDELVLLFKNQHIYQPRRKGSWFMRNASSGQIRKGVKLCQHETTSGMLVFCLEN